MLIPDAFSILSESNLKIASLGSDIIDQEGTPKQPKTIRQLVRVRQLFNLLMKFIVLNTGGTAIDHTIGQNDAALNRLLLQLKRSAQLTSFPVIPNPIQTFVSTYQNSGSIIIINNNISGINNISMTGSLSVVQNISVGGNVTISGALSLTTPLSVTSGGTGLNAISTGDILYGSATNVLSRRAIGSNNTFLQVQSGLPAYTTNFLWDNVNNRLTIGTGNTNNQLSYNFVLGLNCSIDQGAWNFVFGEDNHMTKSGSNSNGIGDNAILSGFQNRILLTDSNPFSGIFETVILGGYDNVSTDATQGTMLGGNHNILTSSRSATVGGEWTEASGYASWAYGHQDDAGHAITPAPTQRVLAAGIHSFNFSSNNNSQTVGHGALANYSFILGGRNQHIPSDSPFSGILGGDGLSARAADPSQIYVPNFNILTTPANDNALTQVLVRDSSTGQIKYRTAASLSTDISGKADKTISLSAGNALSGGGDLSANRTFDVNVDGSTIEISSDSLRLKDGGTTLAKLSSAIQTLLNAVDSAYTSNNVLTSDVVNQAGTASTAITGANFVRYRVSNREVIVAIQVIGIAFAATPGVVKITIPPTLSTYLNNEYGTDGIMIGAAVNVPTGQNIPCIVSVDNANTRLVFTPYGTFTFISGSGINICLNVTVRI